MKPDEAAAQYCKSINVDKDYPFELQGTKYFDNNGNEVTFERIFTAGHLAGQEHERNRIWDILKKRRTPSAFDEEDLRRFIIFGVGEGK